MSKYRVRRVIESVYEIEDEYVRTMGQAVDGIDGNFRAGTTVIREDVEIWEVSKA
jgi:hypothetical protein